MAEIDWAFHYIVISGGVYGRSSYTVLILMHYHTQPDDIRFLRQKHKPQPFWLCFSNVLSSP